MNTKYIFVIGGVMSSIGKGVATASIGKLLQSRGYKVSAIKIDPYINVDAGTMNPTEHGEVFVTEDGDETDQDIGNYERFLGQNIYSQNYMTTGRVYLSVIKKERNLEYQGKCVEVVPHIPEEIIRRIKKAAQNTDSEIIIIEIGGTVGEYQNILFLEAARILKIQHPKDVFFVLVTYLPIPSKIGEMKTKPTQNACRTVNSVGIQPDIILCRSKKTLDQKRKEKIGIFCNVEEEYIISAPDVDNIYEIPLNFEKENLSDKLLKKLNLEERGVRDLKDWKELVYKIHNPKEKIKIGIVGKYFSTGDFILSDSYISIIEAIKHASWYYNAMPDISWLNAEQYSQDPKSIEELKNYHAIIVPGGFGNRGTLGKIKAIEYVRKEKIPFLGICLGMQLAVIEFARNKANLQEANSEELNPNTPTPIIHIMPEQAEYLSKQKYGATMRLGSYPCRLDVNSISYSAYNSIEISERHRHRYEFNNLYRNHLAQYGLRFTGVSPDNKLVEIIELPESFHPFFVGVQFHPEFKSRPLSPHPLFKKLIETALNLKNTV